MHKKQNDIIGQDLPPALDGQQLGGLVLIGTVIDRTRRMVPKDNPTTLIVTYTIDDGMGRKYFVDDYAPKGFFDIGMYVNVPVYVKAYIKRNKEPAYTINIQKEIVSERGERF